MKETSEKMKEVEEKQTEEKKIGNNDLENVAVVKREPNECEDDSCDKVLNTLSDGIHTMNIKAESDDEDECVRDLEKLNISTEVDKKYVNRGPNNGKATSYGQHCSTEKYLPGQKLPNFNTGQNYMNYQAAPVQKQQGRRMAEDAPEQPYKFTRPQMAPQQPYVPGLPQAQFGMQPGFCNNLSQSSDQRLPNTFSNQTQGFNFGVDQAATTAMTQMRFTGSSSGGVVKVTSPVANMQAPFGNSGGNMADAFLEGLDIPESDAGFGQVAQRVVPASVQGTIPPCNIQPTSINDAYSSKAFKQSRRCSDPDSGVESAEERSPYSVQTPSPASSVYTSPPSVDSACGRSPNYEPFPSDKGCSMNGLGSPKYPGMQSPASYRTTPSPAGTSGYGSPLAPQMDEEIFDESRYSELNDILDVLKGDLTKSRNMDKGLRKSIESQQMEISQIKLQKQPGPAAPMNDLHMVNRMPAAPVPTQQNFVPHVMPPHPIQPGVIPQTGVTQPCIAMPPAMSTVGGQQPIPAVPGQQSNIIILPPTSTQPIVVIPVSTPQQQRKPDKKLRKILPKIAGAPPGSGNSTSTSNAMTSTCPSNKTDVTMTTKVTSANGKNSTQAQQMAQCPKMDRLLMIARRTVADIPREDLRKCDDEGDTYLHIAVCRTDRHMVQALLERLHREGLDALVDKENHKRQTPLYLAVYINQPIMVNMFIRFKANVNVFAQNLSADGSETEVKAAIHVAAAHGDDYLRTLTELLRAKDMNINIVNNYGQTALHCAILAHMKAKRNSPDRINSIEIIKTLLRHKADPTAQDKKSGKTPLMYAIEQRNLELVETILSQVEPEKVKNVVKTQAFDGSSCLKIAEGLKDSYNVQIWNRLWNSLQSAASGAVQQAPMQQVY